MNITKEKLGFVNSLQNTITLVNTVIVDLVTVDEMLARIAMQDAMNVYLKTTDTNVKQKINHEVLLAQKEYKMALKCFTQGEYGQSIQHHKIAWQYAQNALSHA